MHASLITTLDYDSPWTRPPIFMNVLARIQYIPNRHLLELHSTFWPVFSGEMLFFFLFSIAFFCYFRLDAFAKLIIQPNRLNAYHLSNRPRGNSRTMLLPYSSSYKSLMGHGDAFIRAICPRSAIQSFCLYKSYENEERENSFND